MCDKCGVSLSDRERLRETKTCPTCGHISGPPKYIWIQYGSGKPKSLWDYGTAAHFEVRSKDSVYCTHGAWGGVLIFDEAGKVVGLKNECQTIKVAGIMPVME